MFSLKNTCAFSLHPCVDPGVIKDKQGKKKTFFSLQIRVKETLPTVIGFFLGARVFSCDGVAMCPANVTSAGVAPMRAATSLSAHILLSGGIHHPSVV